MYAMGTTEAFDFDLHDPNLSSTLYSQMSALREHEPVYRVNDESWIVSLYDDVSALLKDRERCDTDIFDKRGYREERPFGEGSGLEIYMHGLLVNQGGENHRHKRAVFTKPFTRANVENDLQGVVATEAAKLIDALPDEGEIDWVTEVARPMPLNVFTQLFQLPKSDVEWIFTRVHEDSVAFDALLDPSLVPDKDIQRGIDAMMELRDYLDKLAKVRDGQEGTDLLTVMVCMTAGRDDFSWDDGLSQTMEALTAGTGTTQASLNGMIEAFHDHPEEWDKLAADPEMVKPAVEESLRYVSPALGMGRIAKEDFELRGESIRKGDLLMCNLMAANRDPRQFDEPDGLDIHRKPNRHVAFGGGVHTCVGSHLAKLEGREILSRALARWKRIEVDKDNIKMEPELMLRTYNSMPVRLVPR